MKTQSAALLAALALAVPACGGSAGGRSACQGLMYEEYGLTREEYAPCAGEILDTMDALRPLVERLNEAPDRSARREARKEARQVYGRLRTLMKQAGGRNMLEGWADEQLNDLNIALWNAYTGYHAAILAPNATDLASASRNHDEARMLYDYLG